MKKHCRSEQNYHNIKKPNGSLLLTLIKTLGKEFFITPFKKARRVAFADLTIYIRKGVFYYSFQKSKTGYLH